MRTWEDYKKTMRAESPLFECARAGDIAGFERAWNSFERDLEVATARGYSPLMLAAYNGQLDAVDWLLKHGARVDSVDPGGSSVLMGAAFKGEVEIARRLVEAGANVSHQNARQQTAMDFAQAFGRDEMISYLNSLLPQPSGKGWRTRLKAWATFLQPKKTRSTPK